MPIRLDHKRIPAGIMALFGIFIGSNAQAISLAIDEQVACQTAIEEVRWSHMIWPESNPDPKPPLSAVLPAEALQARVIDRQRMAAVLADRYGIEIDSTALQAEINRMSAATRAPDQLRELYAALDNDPTKVAACLAWPTLVHQQLYAAYQWDTNEHAAVRAQAEAALAEDTEAVSADAQVYEVTYVREGAEAAERAGVDLGVGFDEIPLSAQAWSERWAQFEAAENTAKSAPAIALRETAEAFVHEALVSRDSDRLTVRVVSWPKTSFDAWWQTQKATARAEHPAINPSLRLAPITGFGTSKALAAKSGEQSGFVPAGRAGHTAIWTGTEMIVWGGHYHTNSGGRYNPVTDVWIPTSTNNVPQGRLAHTAVWSGTVMIIHGGILPCPWVCLPNQIPRPENDGRYSPLTDTWTFMSMTNAPRPYYHTAVWTGTDMLVFGGANSSAGNSVYRYKLINNTWTQTAPQNAPSARYGHSAIWTGSEMIIWGGGSWSQVTNTGARYHPINNTWTVLALAGAPQGRQDHSAVWAGNEMIIWGGHSGYPNYMPFNTGSRYSPQNNTWTALPMTNAPSAHTDHTAIWTAQGQNQEMIVWGGYDGNEYVNTGRRFSPATNSWSMTSTASAPTGRGRHTAVWTGAEMIVWGGVSDGGYEIVGGRYAPDTDSWQLTNDDIFDDDFEASQEP